MAKLKKAPGRFIGRWKQEAIAANPGASDEELARVINDTARQLGFAYKITPEKVRTKTTKAKGKRPASRPAADAAPTPAVKPKTGGGFRLEDVRAVKGLVERVGADEVQQLAGMLSG
jgi:hypothetical protein